jgi:hypothetical protein
MILVDTSIVIDVLDESQAWGVWSREALAQAADRSAIAINPLVYAEASVAFEEEAEFRTLILAAGFRQLALPYSAAFVAGKAHLEYRRRGGKRTSPLPDFYIGAHAAVMGIVLMTRDPQRYRSYFPTLRMITPEGMDKP